MRVIVIGATGTIGREVTSALQAGHDVVTASRSGGELHVDLADPDSIEGMFRQAGVFRCRGIRGRGGQVRSPERAGL